MVETRSATTPVAAGFPEMSERLVVQYAELHAIDKAVLTYHRKLAGKERWTDFEALLPASVKERL